MALFNHALVQEITALVRQRYQELGKALEEPRTTERPNAPLEQSSLARHLTLLIRVANGEYIRREATPAMIRRTELAISHVLGLLLGNALHTNLVIPDDFWQTDMGVLISRARWWVASDKLITISNAAALAFGENSQANRMRITRAIDRGLLDWVPDPSIANPQQNKRVSRPQVERLRDQSRLPE
jgi:hypothetical protein